MSLLLIDGKRASHNLIALLLAPRVSSRCVVGNTIKEDIVLNLRDEGGPNHGTADYR